MRTSSSRSLLIATLLVIGSCASGSPPPVLSDQTQNFAFVQSDGTDDIWKLMEWKYQHPEARVVNILPITSWRSRDEMNFARGFILYYVQLNQPVTQFFARVEGSESDGVRFGMDSLAKWKRSFPSAELLAIAALPPADGRPYPYLVCFETPIASLPDSLAHYYESIPVEPNEFTPLTDAKAPMLEDRRH